MTSTGMDGHLWAGKLLKYFTKPARPTQPSTLSGRENEYEPKCRDVLWLRSKGRCDLLHFWINVSMLCYLLLTRAYPGAL